MDNMKFKKMNRQEAEDLQVHIDNTQTSIFDITQRFCRVKGQPNEIELWMFESEINSNIERMEKLITILKTLK